MADSTSGNLTLPSFDNDSSYILKGETLNDILSVIKENRVVLTGDVAYEETGPDGSKLPLRTLKLTGLGTISLDVCVDGSPQSVAFVTLTDPNSPIWNAKFVTLDRSSTDLT